MIEIAAEGTMPLHPAQFIPAPDFAFDGADCLVINHRYYLPSIIGCAKKQSFCFVLIGVRKKNNVCFFIVSKFFFSNSD